VSSRWSGKQTERVGRSLTCFKKRQQGTARILIASLSNLFGTPAARVCRSARLVSGFLWLLSTLSFGQNSLLLSPTAFHPRADSELFHSWQPSPDQVHSRFSAPSLPSVPLHSPSAAPADKTGLVPARWQTGTQLSGEQKTYMFEMEPVRSGKSSGFRWGPALGQSLLFLGAEHGARLAFDRPSRAAFSGKFWKDYVASLREVDQWEDGNPTFINYLGHPMQGSVAGFIQIQNDPSGRSLPISWSKPYWNSRLKALAWSAAYSTYFEIGFPFSEAAMGNLGVDKNRKTQQGVVDLVITPTLGLGWLVSEDLIDSYVVDRFERSHPGKVGQALIRITLNPTRSFSNLLRFKSPWYRDGRHLGTRRSDVLKTALRLNGEEKTN
jgi:hypothetical protein